MGENKIANILVTSYIILIILSLLIPFFELFEELDIDINLNPNDYTRITDIDYKAIVSDKSDGKVFVTERITFDVHAASKRNLYWELWRDLPEDYDDGIKVGYNVTSVKEILDNGEEIKYIESPKLYWEDEDYTNGAGYWYYSPGPYSPLNRRYECVFFYVDGLYRDNVTFEIEYEMSNAALHYNDCSELYLSMYSGSTIKYLKSFKGQILFPNEIMPDKDNYSAHTFGTNNNSFKFTESNSINPGYYTFNFELDENQLKFKPYNEYIEFNLMAFGNDKDIFTKNAPYHQYYYYDYLDESIGEQKEYDTTPLIYAKIKLIILIINILFVILIISNTSKLDKEINKKYTFYKPENEYIYFRDIPEKLDPIFASSLVFCRTKPPKSIKEQYGSVILSLVQKKYIELEKENENLDWIPANISIIIKYQEQSLEPQIDSFITHTFEPLTESEQLFFNLITRYARFNKLNLYDFENKIIDDYENTNSFLTRLRSVPNNIGISKNYFQKLNYTEPKRKIETRANIYLVLGIILILSNILLYFTRLDFAFGSLFFSGISIILISRYVKKLGYNYVLLTQLGTDEYEKWYGLYNFLNSETLMKERTIVELPMWEYYLIYATAFGISKKVIKAINLRCPEEVIAKSVILSNSYYRSHSFYSHSTTFRHHTHHASHISRSSYYGGGGRGGRRRWRRSLK